MKNIDAVPEVGNYLISIRDLGCINTVILGPKGTVREIGSCPAPAAEILKGIRRYNDLDKLARVVLNRWMDGYDGDPIASDLQVEISDAASSETLYHLRAASL